MKQFFFTNNFNHRGSYDMTISLFDWDKVSTNDFISAVKFPLTPVTSDNTGESKIYELPVRFFSFVYYFNSDVYFVLKYEVNLKKRKKLLGKIVSGK